MVAMRAARDFSSKFMENASAKAPGSMDTAELMASAKSSIAEEIRAPICSANPFIIWPMACPIVSLIIWLRDAPSPWPRSPES